MRWSPDGTKLAYTVPDSNQTFMIEVLEWDKETVWRATPPDQPAWDGTFSWSPDSQHLVYSSQGPSDLDAVLLTVKFDGTDVHALPVARVSFNPAWSPDGRSIAFVSRGFDPQHQGDDLCVVGLDEKAPTLVGSGLGSIGPPVWSPDSSTLAFLAFHSQVGLYSVKADGSALTPLYTDGVSDKEEPVWSPDGSRICFVSGSTNLMLVSADGSQPVNLNETVGYWSCRSPQWSVDGESVAFLGVSTKPGSVGRSRVVVVDVGRKTPRVVADLSDLPAPVGMQWLHLAWGHSKSEGGVPSASTTLAASTFSKSAYGFSLTWPSGSGQPVETTGAPCTPWARLNEVAGFGSVPGAVYMVDILPDSDAEVSLVVRERAASDAKGWGEKPEDVLYSMASHAIVPRFATGLSPFAAQKTTTDSGAVAYRFSAVVQAMYGPNNNVSFAVVAGPRYDYLFFEYRGYSSPDYPRSYLDEILLGFTLLGEGGG